MSSALSLIATIDRLYESVVTEPAVWNQQAFSDWAEDIAAGGLSREQGRTIRRCMRMAERLRDFWLNEAALVTAEDWQTRVDVALGARAWRPTLELAQDELAHDPSPEVFELVRERFRTVYSEYWMDGVDYDEWLASQS